MKNLLKYEYRRLFRQKSFIVFLAVGVGLVFLSLGSVKLLEIATMSEYDEMTTTEMIFGASYNGINAFRDGIANSNATMITAIITAIFVCSEYSFGTIKTVACRGCSRLKIFTAEFIAAMTASLIFAAAAFISSLLFGTLFWNIGKFKYEALWSVLLQTLVLLAMTAVFFMLSKLVKKTGGAIALGIFSPTVLNLLLSVADSLIGSKKFKISEYWLSGCLSAIQATSPLSTDVFALMQGRPSLGATLIVRTVIVSVAYIVLSFVLGNLAFRKQEI